MVSARFQPMRSWILGSQSGEVLHEYKDHNFVIDFAEAQAHLGVEWVKSGTHELQAIRSKPPVAEVNEFYKRGCPEKSSSGFQRSWFRCWVFQLLRCTHISSQFLGISAFAQAPLQSPGYNS